MIKVKVNGKNRIIRDKFIHYQTEHDLECDYKNHYIYIAEQETGGWYVTVTHESGMYAVQGGFGGGYDKYEKLEDVLVMCIENILI